MESRVINGDCLDVLRTLPDASVDSIVTDPPYGLEFMGKKWDYDVPTQQVWEECLRVLKPGGHLLSFFGARTYHRGVVRIEDAGFEIRDQIGWAYGSGFPKSLDVGKAIDKAAGVEREVLQRIPRPNSFDDNGEGGGGYKAQEVTITAPATDAAKKWHGWGTALKPAFEPLVVAQKPYTPQQELAILAPTVIKLCEDASSGKTGTPSSESGRADGFSNTAGSLSSALADLLPHASRFTTETATALTTDLRILKSCLSKTTPGTTTEATNGTGGGASDAELADAISRSALAKCERLAPTSAGEIAIEWQGQTDREGKSVKPNWESIAVARKPLIGTVAENVLAHGTGAINVDGCRIPATDKTKFPVGDYGTRGLYGKDGDRTDDANPSGRWPANLVHDGSEEVVGCFPNSKSSDRQRVNKASIGYGGSDAVFTTSGHSESGSAARFFYCAKASKRDRDEGLDHLEEKPAGKMAGRGGTYENPNGAFQDRDTRLRNTHPTVKPTDLMRWLVRLVTPPGGTVLDPFCGSGSTGKAAKLEGFGFIGIEREEEYADIANARINAADTRAS